MNYALEYVICRDTIFYFIEEHLKIELREHQLNDILHIIDMDHGDHYDISASRGDGTTFSVLIVALWAVLFHPNIKVALCGNSLMLLNSSMDIFYDLYDKFQKNIPENERVVIKESNTFNKHVFSNNSELYLIINTDTGLRGRNFEYIFVDNASYPDNHAYMYNRVVNVRTS